MQLRTRCALIAAALLAACGAESETNEPASSPAPPASESVADHMQNHFTRVLAVRDAVVLGRIDDTRAPAAWLAEHGAPANTPEGWLPHVAELRERASAVHDAADLSGVARATGALSVACGRCHEALGAKITFAYGPPPPDEPGAAARMLRHDWAVDRLWEGIVTPSDEAWSAGAEVLAGAPLAPTSVTGDGPIDPAIADLASAVHDLGDSARTERGPAARGALFGALLETCAGCHARAGVPRAHVK